MRKIEILEFVQQHHPHMGESEIIKRVNGVLDDFCLETEILKKMIDIGDTVAGQRYYHDAEGLYNVSATANVDSVLESYGWNGEILKVLNVWIDDVLIPRIVTQDAARLIDDDEYTVGDNELSTPSSTSNERYWYLIDNISYKLGIVENSNRAVTRDGKISNFQSISESGLQIRVHAICRAAHMHPESSTTSAIISTKDNRIAAWTLSIPTMFHNSIVDKVISIGYRDARNKDLQMVQYFDNEYEKAIKKAKRWARSGGVTTGFVAPCSY